MEEDMDTFPVGAASVDHTASLDSEISKLRSQIQSAQAEVLLLQSLNEIAKNSDVNRGKTDDTHIARAETVLVDKASAINLPQNLAAAADEAAALLEALNMQPEEMERRFPSYCSLLKRIKDTVNKCSSAQLELLEIQNDISPKLRQVQEMEGHLMKKKSKLANDLEEQGKQLEKKKNSEDAGYERKNKEVQNLVSQINMMKKVIQGLIFLSPEVLNDDKCFEILESTRKSLNLATYSTKL